MASTIAVANEEVGVASRFTQDGRKLTYTLKVVQQPERARACGQGAKASSDRRPVDPPPIVELRILEGEEGHQHDITFAHNASYFLFATLENARTIAQGRVSQSQQATAAPVLTGTPVAGMAYLERPVQAGYFIFPDLSVRHEGKYRLAFTLYEGLKHPKDADSDAYEQSLVNSDGAGGHVHGRCEVKSVPFTVYSAKKFPGLTESTSLSRTVADQGCRVRIRRDVRMRRREGKPGKDIDDFDDEQEASIGASEELAIQHQASNSTSATDAVDRSATLGHQSDMPLPPSLPHAYQPPSPAYEHPYHHQTSHYTPASAMAHTFHQQAYQYPTQPPMHQQYGYIPPPPMNEQYANFGAPPPVPNFGQYQMTPSYAPQNAPLDYGRPPPPPPAPPFQAQPFNPTSTQAGSQLPPLKTLENPQTKMENTSPISSNVPTRQPSYDLKAMPLPPSVFVNNAAGPAPKRSYGTVFNTEHIQQSLRAGARPDNHLMHSPPTSSPDGSDSDMDSDVPQMTYRRANGEMTHRTWPM